MNFCGKVTDILLPSAAKRVELINFSKPKRCFGLRDNPAAISNILDNPEFFRIFVVFRLRQTKKKDIGFGFCTSKYSTLI